METATIYVYAHNSVTKGKEAVGIRVVGDDKVWLQKEVLAHIVELWNRPRHSDRGSASGEKQLLVKRTSSKRSKRDGDGGLGFTSTKNARLVVLYADGLVVAHLHNHHKLVLKVGNRSRNE